MWFGFLTAESGGIDPLPACASRTRFQRGLHPVQFTLHGECPGDRLGSGKEGGSGENRTPNTISGATGFQDQLLVHSDRFQRRSLPAVSLLLVLLQLAVPVLRVAEQVTPDDWHARLPLELETEVVRQALWLARN